MLLLIVVTTSKQWQCTFFRKKKLGIHFLSLFVESELAKRWDGISLLTVKCHRLFVWDGVVPTISYLILLFPCVFQSCCIQEYVIDMPTYEQGGGFLLEVSWEMNDDIYRSHESFISDTSQLSAPRFIYCCHESLSASHLSVTRIHLSWSRVIHQRHDSFMVVTSHLSAPRPNAVPRHLSATRLHLS